MSAEPLVVRAAIGDDLDAVAPALTQAFLDAREALEAERPVVFLVAGGDLLGQGSVAGAAVATGLLGMMRTLAIEGAKPGWRVNMVGAREGEDELAERAVSLLAQSGLSGQLIQAGSAQLGKVVP